MIAALVLVALVAVAGQAQAMPDRLVEVQPFYELAGLRELRCVLNEIPEAVAVLRKASEHQTELLAAAKELVQRLAPCAGAADKMECANEKIQEYLESDLDANIKDIFNRIGAISARINKCAAYEY